MFFSCEGRRLLSAPACHLLQRSFQGSVLKLPPAPGFSRKKALPSQRRGITTGSPPSAQKARSSHPAMRRRRAWCRRAAGTIFVGDAMRRPPPSTDRTQTTSSCGPLDETADEYGRRIGRLGLRPAMSARYRPQPVQSRLLGKGASPASRYKPTTISAPACWGAAWRQPRNFPWRCASPTRYRRQRRPGIPQARRIYGIRRRLGAVLGELG